MTNALDNEIAPAILQLQTDLIQLTVEKDQIVDGINNEIVPAVIQLQADTEQLGTDVDNIELTPGPQGLPGNDGAAGPQGLPGNDGAAGPQGLPGNDGADGAQGPAGADGADGNDGLQGDVGPPGPVDNLGNHLATQTLDMNSQNILNSGDINVGLGTSTTEPRLIMSTAPSTAYIQSSFADLKINAGGNNVILGGNNPAVNVGIGTSTPSSQLHVAGNAQFGIGGAPATPAMTVTTSSGITNIQSLWAPLTINTLGENVGIGVTDPKEKLDVGGNLHFSNSVTTITSDGSICIGTCP